MRNKLIELPKEVSSRTATIGASFSNYRCFMIEFWAPRFLVGASFSTFSASFSSFSCFIFRRGFGAHF